MTNTEAHPQLAMLKALAAAKTDMPVLPKDKTNPHFKSKYTSLDILVEKVEPVLEAHGLVWTTMPGFLVDCGPVLHYQLLHVESGGGIEGTMPLLLAKKDPQGQGSAITYARRYALCAVLNLVADEDDDGNSASEPPKPAAKPKNNTAKPKPVKDNPPTELPSREESDPEVAKLAAKIKGSGMEASAVKLKLISLGIEDPKNLESALGKLSAEKRTDLLEWVEGGSSNGSSA